MPGNELLRQYRAVPIGDLDRNLTAAQQAYVSSFADPSRPDNALQRHVDFSLGAPRFLRIVVTFENGKQGGVEFRRL